MNPRLLPAVAPDHVPAWQQSVLAFLAEKERRSGSRRTVEGYARMLRRGQRRGQTARRWACACPGGRTRAGKLEPTLGFEPRTCCLRNSCSTAELCRPGAGV